jgi:pyridinium-3,5-bisthiocarboxylic acid mononucleotide nickel chelatase
MFLDSVAGVAGDMFAAAFVDAGIVTIKELNDVIAQLGLTGVRVASEDVIRATIRATRISVEADSEEWKHRFSKGHSHDHQNRQSHTHDHHHHDHSSNLALSDEARDHWHVHYGEIDKLLADSSLEIKIKELARQILRLLGEAEASVHGIELEKAAFHELGTIDSIADVVMAAHCIRTADATHVFATPIKPGRGTINIAHGTHAVPPPATMQLLVGMAVAATPAAITAENIELSTPTGVAILKTLSPQFVNELPTGRVIAEGRGSGTKDLGNFPNVFRLVVLEGESTKSPYLQDKVVEIACNIDDDTGEHLAWMCEKLLVLGALDVWQTPGTGKKGRPMVCLSVLAEEAKLEELADWILRNGTTFGVRYRTWDRQKLAPTFEERDGVTVKIGSDAEGTPIKEKIEFESWKSGR